MDIKRKPITTNILWNWTNYFFNIVISIYITRLLIDRLGDESYGAWVLVGSLVGYYGFVNFGIDSSVVRYISKHFAEKNKDELQKVLSTCLVYFSIQSLFILLLTSIFAYLFFYYNSIFENIFSISKSLRFEFAIVIIISSISIAFTSIGKIFMGILRASERYDILNGINIALLVIRTMALIMIAYQSIIIVSLIFGVSLVLANIAYIIFGLAIIGKFEIKWNHYNLKTFYQLSNYGIFTFITFLSDQFIFYTDSIVLGHFVNMSVITYFSLGNTLIKTFRNIIGTAATPFFPFFSRSENTNQTGDTHETFLRASKVLALMSALLGGILLGSGKQFLNIWVGDKIGEANVLLSYYVLIILLIPSIILSCQSISVSFLYGISKHKYLSKLGWIEGAANFIISIVLVQKYGVIGVAFGTAIPMFITKIFFLPKYVCKQIGVKSSKYIINFLIIPLIMTCTLGAIQFLLYSVFKEIFLLQLIIVTTISLVVFAICYFYFYFSKEERLWLTNRLKVLLKPFLIPF